MPLLTDNPDDLFDTADYPYPPYGADGPAVREMLKQRHERAGDPSLTYHEAKSELAVLAKVEASLLAVLPEEDRKEHFVRVEREIYRHQVWYNGIEQALNAYRSTGEE